LVRDRPIGIGNGVGVQLGGFGGSTPGIADGPVDDEQADVDALGSEVTGQRLGQHPLGSLLRSKPNRHGLATEGSGRPRH